MDSTTKWLISTTDLQLNIRPIYISNLGPVINSNIIYLELRFSIQTLYNFLGQDSFFLKLYISDLGSVIRSNIIYLQLRFIYTFENRGLQLYVKRSRGRFSTILILKLIHQHLLTIYIFEIYLFCWSVKYEPSYRNYLMKLMCWIS